MNKDEKDKDVISQDKKITPDSPLKKLVKIFRSNTALSFHTQGVGSTTKNPSGTAKAFFGNTWSMPSVYAHSSLYNRFARYGDYVEMESYPIISKALDIYADECTQKDEDGKIIKVISEDKEIKEELQHLLDNILHLNGKDIYKIVRYLCKYGDVFYLIDASEELGVISLILMPANEVEKDQEFDKDDPSAVRYRWTARSNAEIPNAFVAHFRLDGIDQFIPYGQSVLEAARRPWRQSVMMEDHMIAYRVIRTAERKVYYLDMTGIPPENEKEVVNEFNNNLKKNRVVDANGNLDLRFGAAQTVEEDIIIPVRGGKNGTRVETLPGGQNTQEINDIDFIKKNLFAALGIPKAFLTFDESVGSKQTLSMEDVRFARTISRIQECIISEIVKICIIHLYLKGYSGKKLFDFKVKMTNPSTIAELQKNELWRSRMDLVQSAGDGVFDTTFIYKNFLHLSDEAIDLIRKGQIQDKIFQAKLLSIENKMGIPNQGGANMFGSGQSGGMGGLSAPMADAGLGSGGTSLDLQPSSLQSSSLVPESLNPAAKVFSGVGGKDLSRNGSSERLKNKRGQPEDEIVSIEDIEKLPGDIADADGTRRVVTHPFGMEEALQMISNHSGKMTGREFDGFFESLLPVKSVIISAGPSFVSESVLLEQYGNNKKQSSKVLKENLENMKLSNEISEYLEILTGED